MISYYAFRAVSKREEVLFRNHLLNSLSLVLLTVQVFLGFDQISNLMGMDGKGMITYYVMTNAYVVTLQFFWRFTKFRLDGLKNEIDSFDFQKDQLKMDSFDVVHLKQDNSQISQKPTPNSSELQKDENKENSFKTTNRQKQEQNQKMNELWINEDEENDNNIYSKRGYQTFEDSPRKDLELREYQMNEDEHSGEETHEKIESREI